MDVIKPLLFYVSHIIRELESYYTKTIGVMSL